VIKKQHNGALCSTDIMPSMELNKHCHVVNKVSPAAKQASLLNFFSPVSKQG